MNPLNLTNNGRNLLNRRKFLGQTGGVFGSLGLMSLLGQQNLLGASGEAKTPIRPKINPEAPYSARRGHYQGKAKQVLVVYCPGAVSHVDTFLTTNRIFINSMGKSLLVFRLSHSKVLPVISLSHSGTSNLEASLAKWFLTLFLILVKWPMTFVSFTL